jgi:hypothetical protein
MRRSSLTTRTISSTIESTQTPKENKDIYLATSFQIFLSTSTKMRGLLKAAWRYDKEFFCVG